MIRWKALARLLLVLLTVAWVSYAQAETEAARLEQALLKLLKQD